MYRLCCGKFFKKRHEKKLIDKKKSTIMPIIITNGTKDIF